MNKVFKEIQEVRMAYFIKTLFSALGVTVALMAGIAEAQSPLAGEIDRMTEQLESKVVAWRRDIHQNPELGNREMRNAKLVADHLQSLGVEVFPGYPVTFNDPALTERMVPTLKRVAEAGNGGVAQLVTGAEDFSYFEAEIVPGTSIGYTIVRWSQHEAGVDGSRPYLAVWQKQPDGKWLVLIDTAR
jgi:metal-dependent amidase/aminoacylase/carboxypeptidase family protein